MGALQAREFASATENGEIGLEAALTWHFRSNHYPPLPLSLIPVAIKVINNAKKGRYPNVKLPSGILYRGSKSAPAQACLREWHLWDWV